MRFRSTKQFLTLPLNKGRFMGRQLAKILAIICCCVFQVLWSSAQEPQRFASGEIFEGIQKLRVLGSALYVAAHPDDENTRLISHLANDLKVHTTYLSLTRGDGGQNLIGSEISELLGVIRTQELLQARRVDHGEQRFTRANDFGFSKTPDETLSIWNEKEILSDVVWAIRTIQPDIIINRFTTQASEGNHGHHTASAMLSSDAFNKAADALIFPEQLKHTSTWQASRLFLNTSWWFYGSREKFDQVDKSNMAEIDIGGFNSITGWSNTEIAAKSRSMHKSQGFGSGGSRGTEREYLELLSGNKPIDKSDLFEGIDITWNRVPGASHIDKMLAEIEANFDFQQPHLSVKSLLVVRREISSLDESVWKFRKLKEINIIIAQAMGLFVEADAAVYHVAAGDSVSISLEAINRSPIPVELLQTQFQPSATDLQLVGDLKFNTRMTGMRKVLIPMDQPQTTPYWLDQEGTIGMYHVEDQLLRGLPETPKTVTVRFALKVYEDTISYHTPVIYKETDPVKGEVYRPFEIVPPVFVNIQSPVYIFSNTEEKSVHVNVKGAKSGVSGSLRLQAPAGWTVSPSSTDIKFDKLGEEIHAQFSVMPSILAEDGVLSAEFETEGRRCDQMLTEITYDHIPAQTILRGSDAKVVHIDLKTEGQRIAYIHGAGDDVASSLQQIGYAVDILPLEDIVNTEVLRRYDAVILGIRAYNTLDRIKFIQGYLFDYVEEGGTLITQYNTSNGLNAEQLAPYALKIGRKRVTDEHAEVTFLNAEHPALNSPNKLFPADFDGWVQERGLYFADTWDPALEPLLSMSDPGEEALTGGLLVAKHGKGYFVYTGLSFFRQLPDGVPGAYRLFVNLIALGQNGKS